MAPDYNLRMSKVISYGNGYVLDCTDYLEYFENDPETKFIGMYLEGVRDGPKLLRMVQRISPKKPIVILKGGLTAAGARAAASHTGSLAGQNAVWDAFFAQSGAIRVDSIEEMVDVLQAFVRLPPCTGRGAALIGSAGGNGVDRDRHLRPRGADRARHLGGHSEGAADLRRRGRHERAEPAGRWHATARSRRTSFASSRSSPRTRRST